VEKINLLEIVKPVARELEKVEQHLRRSIDSKYDIINEIGSYLFEGKGKRLRPALVLLSASVFKKAMSKAINVAASIEFIHTATLIHDDIIDNAAIRRGKASLNGKYGNTVSVLFGDFLYCEAFKQVSKYEDAYIGKGLLDAAQCMCEGEIYQNINNYNPDITKENYISIIENKTAQFISKCSELGAYCADAKKSQIAAMKKYGLYIGTAFQIADDVFDLAADDETIGKPSGKDLIEGKVTLPVLAMLQKIPKKTADGFKKIISSKDAITGDFIKEIKKTAVECGAISDSLKTAGEYVIKAKEALSGIKAANAKSLQSLSELSDYVIKRKN